MLKAVAPCLILLAMGLKGEERLLHGARPLPDLRYLAVGSGSLRQGDGGQKDGRCHEGGVLRRKGRQQEESGRVQPRSANEPKTKKMATVLVELYRVLYFF